MEVKKETIANKVIRNFNSLARSIFFAFAILFYSTACAVCIAAVYVIYVIFVSLGFSMERYTIAFGTLWVKVTQSLLCILMGDNTTIIYKDTKEKNTEKSLVISNHSAYLDWIYIWVFHVIRGKENVSFIAKSGVSGIYFLALGIKMLNFILLSRNMEQDKNLLEKACSDLKSRKGYNLVLFPEGTFLDKNTKKRDWDFYHKEQEFKEIYDKTPENERDALGKKPKEWMRKPFNNVIFPRTKGFGCLVTNLKNSIDWIQNFTIFYDTQGTGNKYASEELNLSNLLMGRCSLTRVLIICDPIRVSENTDIIDSPERSIFEIFSKKDEEIEHIKEKRKEMGSLIEEYTANGYKAQRIHPSLPVTTFLSAGAVAIFSVVVYFVFRISLYLPGLFSSIQKAFNSILCI